MLAQPRVTKIAKGGYHNRLNLFQTG